MSLARLKITWQIAVNLLGRVLTKRGVFVDFKKSFCIVLFIFANASISKAASLSELLSIEEAPSRVRKIITNTIAKARVDVGLELIDTELIDGLNVNGKYRYEVGPSLVPNFYQRTDRYILNFNLNPSDVLDDEDVPVGFGISRNSEVTFIRSFPCGEEFEPKVGNNLIKKCQSKAFLAIPPYKLSHIPYSSKNAKALQTGDFVSFQTNLNLAVSKSAMVPLSGMLSLSAYAFYLIQGDFTVHAFKLDAKRIRVKFFAQRARAKGGGISVNAAYDVNIFGVNLVDKLIEKGFGKMFHIQPLDISSARAISDLLVLDYIFDLNNPEAANVYDQIMGANLFKVNHLKIANPFDGIEKIKKAAFRNLTVAEDLFEKYKNLPYDVRPVDRIFKATHMSDINSSSFRLGFNILRLEMGTVSAETKIESENENGSFDRYLYSTYSPYKKTKFLFGLDGTETITNANLLFSTDAKFKPTVFENLILSRDVNFRAVSEKEFRGVKAYLDELLPPKMNQHIQWKEWQYPETTNAFDRGFTNGRLRSHLYFKPTAARVIKFNSAIEAINMFQDYIKSFNRLPVSEPADPYMPETSRGLEKWLKDIELIGIRLYQSFGHGANGQDQYNSFLSLKEIPLFHEYGPGFLLKLIPEEQLSQHVSYFFMFGVNDQDTIYGEFGGLHTDRKFKNLEAVQNVINKRAFDMRLYLDEKGHTDLKNR